MRLKFRLTRALTPQIGRYEFVHLRESVFIPMRPDKAPLFADPRERLAAVAKKLGPVQNSARHAAGFDLGVQDVAEPERTPIGEAQAVAAMEGWATSSGDRL